MDCLPRLELKEIVLKTPRVKSRQKNGMSLYKQPTNGLEYWSIYLDNPNINFENLGEFTLICGMLTKIGTQKNSYEEFSALLNQYTGGIAFAACCASRLGYQNYHQFICASAKSLNSNKEKMKQLLVGLKGVAKKNLQAVEDLILDGLKEIVAQKIEPSFIESAIHQTELDIREISEGRYPYSLNLFFRFVGSWMNSGDIIKALSFDEQVESIKQKSKKGGYFESLIQKYLIDNPHRVRVELHPSKDYMKQQSYLWQSGSFGGW